MRANTFFNNVRYISITYLLLAALLSISYNAIAQSKGFNKSNIMAMPDSKAKVDSIIANGEKNRRDPKLDLLFQEAFRIVKKIKYHEAEPALYNTYGFIKRERSEYSAAIDLHNKALDVAKKQKNIKEEIKAYNNLGVAYRRIDDYSNALDYLMQGLQLSEKVGDDYSTTIALNSIGNIHISQGNYREAIDYFLQCMPIALKAGNFRGVAINLNNMGECYEKLDLLDSAKIYYEKALMYNKQRNDDKGIAICYNSIGNLLKRQGKFKEALRLFEMALPLNVKLGDRLFIANSFTNIGNVYLQLKNYDKASQMFDTSLSIAQEIGSVWEARSASEGLMKTAEAEKKWMDAYHYSNTYKILSDSLLNVKNRDALTGKEAAYHENKIKLLETNQKNDRIIIIGSFILFSLVLVSGLLYYLRNKLLERNRSLQRELEIRSQIASDLHDDMGSSLSSIHIFSELLRKDGNNSNDLLSKIEANAKDTLEALDDIIWLVKPSNDKFSDLGLHISEFAIPLFESKNIKFHIDFPESIAELPLPMETRRNIFLIIKESVNNLAKYSECTEAVVKAEQKGNEITFTVKDNGKGFDPLKLTNRNGIKNLKARANQINSDISINAAPGAGTEIVLTVNIKELSSVQNV